MYTFRSTPASETAHDTKEVCEMGDCIVRLNQLIDQLSPAEARVARYLLDHCQEAIGQPIEKVSEACQTSKTTVVRLCKQLGFKG